MFLILRGYLGFFFLILFSYTWFFEQTLTLANRYISLWLDSNTEYAAFSSIDGFVIFCYYFLYFLIEFLVFIYFYGFIKNQSINEIFFFVFWYYIFYRVVSLCSVLFLYNFVDIVNVSYEKLYRYTELHLYIVGWLLINLFVFFFGGFFCFSTIVFYFIVGWFSVFTMYFGFIFIVSVFFFFFLLVFFNIYILNFKKK